MKFQRKKVATALACAFGVGSMAMLAAQAQAQQQPAQADIRVEVTGSNIKRVEGEGALPVTVLTREDINRSGATTAAELLQIVSANNSLASINMASTVGAFAYGNQTASLRGLGGGATLILVDGKRLTGYGLESVGTAGTNLSTIPLAAIERVEILRDGASAVYGSDAVAGVINFITRKDYTGMEAEATYGAPTRSGGGDQYIISGSAGFGDLNKDRYNAFLSLSYNQSNSLDGNKRDFANTSYRPDIGLSSTSGNSFPGNVSPLDGSWVGNPNWPNCGANNIPFANGTCRFDPQEMNGVEILPQQKLWNFFGSFNWQLTRDVQAYVRGLYSRSENTYQIQMLPVPFVLDPSSPYYPHAIAAANGSDGDPLVVSYRSVLSGLRNWTDTAEGGQFIAGLKGTVNNWDWDASGFYSQSDAKEVWNNGNIRDSLIEPLLGSGLVNPFGPTPSDVAAQVHNADFNGETFNGTAKAYGVDGKMSGDVFKLPAGMASLAFGAEYRREELDQNPSALFQSGDLLASSSSGPISASRDVYALYGEMNFPLVKTLELDVAARYDHYSDFGSTTNPKVSLRWQPTSTFLARGSYGTGFLAPTLFQLDSTQTLGFTDPGLDDPLRCPTTGNLHDCNAQFNGIFGGNPNLKPQRSWQATGGIVWEPMSGASVSLDYFSLTLSDSIFTAGLVADYLLSSPAIAQQYSDLIHRGPVDPAFPNLPGPIVDIQQTPINLGDTKMQGIDIDLRYVTPASSLGRFRFGVAGTYYLKYDLENVDGSYTGIVSNNYGSAATGVIPRYKQYATVTWEIGPWATTLGNNFQSSYTDSHAVQGNLRTVGSMSLWDLQTSYTGFKNWTLTLGAKNIFDTDPPVTNVTGNFTYGYDSSYYDPRARFIYGTVKYAFK
jgi:iron complex outermembrane recepter protein